MQTLLSEQAASKGSVRTRLERHMPGAPVEAIDVVASVPPFDPKRMHCPRCMHSMHEVRAALRVLQVRPAVRPLGEALGG